MSRNYIPFKLDCLEVVQQELYSKYLNLATGDKLRTQKFEWNQRNFGLLYGPIHTLTTQFGISVITARFFYTPPHTELEPHVDGSVITEKYWALNIPISVDSENHYQEWFSYDGELLVDNNQIYSNSIKPKAPENLMLVDRLMLLTPHFVKVGTFHKVINNSSKGRFVLSIRFTSSEFISALD